LDFKDNIEGHPNLDKIGNIDFFINNAGLTHTSTLRNLNLEKLEDVFQVNVFSPISLILQLLKRGKLNKDSSIVFTTSVAGKSRFSIGNVIYGVSKASIEGFAKGVAAQLAELRIRVNCVSPALINTNFNQSTSITNEQYENHTKEYPLMRIGETNDVVNAILFYINSENSWITGTSLDIDGGLSIKKFK
jgi:NAD(P)-dependent dehydrogenase (short-subunit alcohol dehydrogenase family)